MQVPSSYTQRPLIRLAAPSDAARLATFLERAFRDTFAADNTPADMAAYCAHAFGVDIETRQLHDPLRRCLIAECEGEMAACVQLAMGARALSVTGAAPVEIQRFYVDRAVHGQGLAQQLMVACLADARSQHCETVWLGVWERNARAIRFYERCGFRTVGTQQFVLGSDLQHDLVMARSLSNASSDIAPSPST